MWYWRRMQKIGETVRERNEELLHTVKEKRNILHTIKRKANWIGHILCKNRLQKHIIQGKIGGIEVLGRQVKRCKQLLNYLKETRGCWKLKEEASDRTLWRTRFGRGYGPVVRHYGMSE